MAREAARSCRLFILCYCLLKLYNIYFNRGSGELQRPWIDCMYRLRSRPVKAKMMVLNCLVTSSFYSIDFSPATSLVSPRNHILKAVVECSAIPHEQCSNVCGNAAQYRCTPPTVYYWRMRASLIHDLVFQTLINWSVQKFILDQKRLVTSMHICGEN